MIAIDDQFSVSEYKPGLFAKIFTVFFSYLFHPVFVPFYVVYFLLYIHPFCFTGFSSDARLGVLLIVLLNAVFFPLFSVLLLRALGFIKSIKLEDQKDRIIPFIAAGIFFFWTYTVFYKQDYYPDLIKIFFLGIFLASSIGLIANIYIKISLHAIGMGGWLGLFLVIFIQHSMLMTWPLALVILFTGAVCSARILKAAHSPLEIYIGLIVGMMAQFVATIVI